MHDVILKALSSLHSLSREEEISSFLRELKPAAKYLWHAYQSGSVCVSYKKLSVQAAYMLRYFPHYAELTRVILEELFMEGKLPFREHLLQVSLFGCGPAPELFGIMQFLKSRFPRSEMLIAHLFDLASENWNDSRRITLDYLAPTLWDKQLFEAHAIPLDLSWNGSAAALATINGGSNIISESSLVTLQNCLNELPRSIHTVVTENILDLLRMMKSGKVMLVIDRSSYHRVADLLSSICSLAKEKALAQVLIFDQDRELDCKSILDKMPPILTESLFVRKTQWSDIAPNEDGLICARTVRYHCLALQRV